MSDDVAPVPSAPDAAPPPAPEPAAAPDAPPPTTTQAIAATVIAEAESDAPGDAPPEPIGERPTAPPTPPPELSLEEQLLHEFGFKEARWPDGREHRIPRSKVLQMIGSGLKRGQAKWDGERSALETQQAQYKTAIESILGGIRGDPKAFLTELATHDPRYQSYLEPPAAPAPRATPPPVAEMPGPDLALPDGSRTYSVEGLKALLDWNTAAAEARVRAAVEAQLKPWQERDQQRQAEAAEEALRAKTRTQLDTARSWPQWGDYEADILKALQKDSADAEREGRRPTMTLREAYLEVRSTRLSADRQTVRQELVNELNAAPRSTAVTRTGTEPTRPARPRTTAEIARATIAAAQEG